MARTKSTPSSKPTRTSKSEPDVEAKLVDANAVDAGISDRPTAIDNAPTTLDAEPVETQVKPSVQVSTSTSEPAPEAVFNARKSEASGKSEANTKPDVNNKMMFEVRKTEPRKNVIPINLEDEIRRRAYELFQQRGQRSGGEADDWLTAEREVMQRYHQQSA